MALTEASAFKDGSINTADIADNAVTTNKIPDNAVTTAKLPNDAVTGPKIADGTITTGHISGGSIDSVLIATGAVLTSKIADDAVTTDKIPNNAITTNKIPDDAITTAKINDSAINTQKIGNSAVTSAKITDGAITQAKIDSAVIFTPVGTVITYAGSTAPTGYLKANGDTIPDGSGTVQGVTADFSALYAIVGGTLPDLRGEFIRGVDDSRGIDSGRQIRSTQSDNFKNHQHEFGADDQVRTQGSYTSLGTFNYDATSNVNGGGQRLKTKNDNTNSGGTETRPRNVALLMCIKY
mgnify:CR=1 FL=1|tara:strand:- start:41 stop:925 length:885 start_codon:yes stop_codon:yes gene_type:complete